MKSFRSAVASLTAAAMVVTAVPLPPVQAAAAGEVPLSELSAGFILDRSLGKIIETHERVNADTPWILHIQDAHANPSAQKKIAAILEAVETQLPHADWTIALEGMVGSLRPDYLNFFPRYPEVTQDVVNSLMEKGELTGAELYAWKNFQEKSVRKDLFAGVDEPELYRENLRLYQDFLNVTAAQKHLFEVMRKTLHQLENQTLTKEARHYLREKRRRKDGNYQSGHESPQWASYLAFLKKELLARTGVDLDDRFEQLRFPNTVRLLVLMDTAGHAEASAEREMFFQEMEKRVRSQEEKDLVWAFKNHEAGTPLRNQAESVWELARRYRVDAARVRHFWAEEGRRILEEELDAGALDAELEQLELWLEAALAASPEEREVFRQGRDLETLQKLLSLELPSRSWDSLRQNQAPIDRALELAPARERETVRPWVRKALRFYELARERDQTLLQNTLDAAAGKQLAVLITGGFHTEGLTGELRRRGIGYSVIQPNVDSTDGGALYRRVAGEENADLSAYFDRPYLNKQEAIFFKSMVETGAAALWEKARIPHDEIAAETAEAIRAHPVLSERLDVYAHPDKAKGSRLDFTLTQTPSAGQRSSAADAVMITPVTSADFSEIYPSRSVQPDAPVLGSVDYAPVGLGVSIQRSEVRSSSKAAVSVYQLPVDDFIQELGDGWTLLAETEQRALRPLLERLRIVLTGSVRAPETLEEFEISYAHTYAVLRNLFSVRSQRGEVVPPAQSRLHHILDQMGVHPSAWSRSELLYQTEEQRAEIEEIGSGQNRIVDRVSVIIPEESQRTFTASYYRADHASAWQRARSEQEALREVRHDPDLYPLRVHFQTPYGAVRTAQGVISYKSYAPGESLANIFEERLFNRSSDARVPQDFQVGEALMGEMGRYLGHFVRLSHGFVPDTHLGNSVAEVDAQGLIEGIQNIDFENGIQFPEKLIEVQTHTLVPAFDLLQRNDDSKAAPLTPEEINPMVDAYLAEFYAAMTGSDPAPLRVILAESRPVIEKRVEVLDLGSLERTEIIHALAGRLSEYLLSQEEGTAKSEVRAASESSSRKWLSYLVVLGLGVGIGLHIPDNAKQQGQQWAQNVWRNGQPAEEKPAAVRQEKPVDIAEPDVTPEPPAVEEELVSPFQVVTDPEPAPAVSPAMPEPQREPVNPETLRLARIQEWKDFLEGKVEKTNEEILAALEDSEKEIAGIAFQTLVDKTIRGASWAQLKPFVENADEARALAVLSLVEKSALAFTQSSQLSFAFAHPSEAVRRKAIEIAAAHYVSFSWNEASSIFRQKDSAETHLFLERQLLELIKNRRIAPETVSLAGLLVSSNADVRLQAMELTGDIFIKIPVTDKELAAALVIEDAETQKKLAKLLLEGLRLRDLPSSDATIEKLVFILGEEDWDNIFFYAQKAKISLTDRVISHVLSSAADEKIIERLLWTVREQPLAPAYETLKPVFENGTEGQWQEMAGIVRKHAMTVPPSFLDYAEKFDDKKDIRKKQAMIAIVDAANIPVTFEFLKPYLGGIFTRDTAYQIILDRGIPYPKNLAVEQIHLLTSGRNSPLLKIMAAQNMPVSLEDLSPYLNEQRLNNTYPIPTWWMTHTSLMIVEELNIPITLQQLRPFLETKMPVVAETSIRIAQEQNLPYFQLLSPEGRRLVGTRKTVRELSIGEIAALSKEHAWFGRLFSAEIAARLAAYREQKGMGAIEELEDIARPVYHLMELYRGYVASLKSESDRLDFLNRTAHLILQQRENAALSEKVVLGPDTKLIILAHEEMKQDADNIEAMARDKFKVKEIVKLQGTVDPAQNKTVKDEYLRLLTEAVRHPEQKVTIWQVGHGGPQHFWLNHGQVGIEASDELRNPSAVSYHEEWERLDPVNAQRSSDLSHIFIIRDACWQYDASREILNRLIRQDSSVSQPPAVFTLSNRGEVAQGSYMYKSIKKVTGEKSTLVWKDMFALDQAIRESTGIHADPAFFIPVDMEAINRGLGFQDNGRAPTFLEVSPNPVPVEFNPLPPYDTIALARSEMRGEPSWGRPDFGIPPQGVARDQDARYDAWMRRPDVPEVEAVVVPEPAVLPAISSSSLKETSERVLPAAIVTGVLAVAAGLVLWIASRLIDARDVYPDFPENVKVSIPESIPASEYARQSELQPGQFRLAAQWLEQLLGHTPVTSDPDFQSIAKQMTLFEVEGDYPAGSFFYSSILSRMDKKGRLLAPADSRETLRGVPGTTLAVRAEVSGIRSGQTYELLQLQNASVVSFESSAPDLFRADGRQVTALRDQGADEKVVLNWTLQNQSKRTLLEWLENDVEARQLETLPEIFRTELERVRDQTDMEKLETIVRLAENYFEYAQVPFALKPGQTWGERAQEDLDRYEKVRADCDVLATYVYLFARLLDMDAAVLIGLSDQDTNGRLTLDEAHAINVLTLNIDGRDVSGHLDITRYVPTARIEAVRQREASNQAGVFESQSSELDLPLLEFEKRDRVSQDSVKLGWGEYGLFAFEELAKQERTAKGEALNRVHLQIALMYALFNKDFPSAETQRVYDQAPLETRLEAFLELRQIFEERDAQSFLDLLRQWIPSLDQDGAQIDYASMNSQSAVYVMTYLSSLDSDRRARSTLNYERTYRHDFKTGDDFYERSLEYLIGTVWSEQVSPRQARSRQVLLGTLLREWMDDAVLKQMTFLPTLEDRLRGEEEAVIRRYREDAEARKAWVESRKTWAVETRAVMERWILQLDQLEPRIVAPEDSPRFQLQPLVVRPHLEEREAAALASLYQTVFMIDRGHFPVHWISPDRIVPSAQDSAELQKFLEQLAQPGTTAADLSAKILEAMNASGKQRSEVRAKPVSRKLPQSLEDVPLYLLTRAKAQAVQVRDRNVQRDAVSLLAGKAADVIAAVQQDIWRGRIDRSGLAAIARGNGMEAAVYEMITHIRRHAEAVYDRALPEERELISAERIEMAARRFTRKQLEAFFDNPELKKSPLLREVFAAAYTQHPLMRILPLLEGLVEVLQLLESEPFGMESVFFLDEEDEFDFWGDDTNSAKSEVRTGSNDIWTFTADQNGTLADEMRDFFAKTRIQAGQVRQVVVQTPEPVTISFQDSGSGETSALTLRVVPGTKLSVHYQRSEVRNTEARQPYYLEHDVVSVEEASSTGFIVQAQNPERNHQTGIYFSTRYMEALARQLGQEPPSAPDIEFYAGLLSRVRLWLYSPAFDAVAPPVESDDEYLVSRPEVVFTDAAGNALERIEGELPMVQFFEPLNTFETFSDEKDFYRYRNRTSRVLGWGNVQIENVMRAAYDTLMRIPFLYSSGWSHSGAPSDHQTPWSNFYASHLPEGVTYTPPAWDAALSGAHIQARTGRDHAGYVELRIHEDDAQVPDFMAAVNAIDAVDIVPSPRESGPTTHILRVMVPQEIIEANDQERYESWVVAKWLEVEQAVRPFARAETRTAEHLEEALLAARRTLPQSSHYGQFSTDALNQIRAGEYAAAAKNVRNIVSGLTGPVFQNNPQAAHILSLDAIAADLETLAASRSEMRKSQRRGLPPLGLYDEMMAVNEVVAAFATDEKRTELPDAHVLAGIFGAEDYVFERHYDDLLRALRVRMDQWGFNPEIKVRLEQAMPAAKIVALFEQNAGLTELPSIAEISLWYKADPGRFEAYRPDLLQELRKKMEQPGMDEGVKARIEKAMAAETAKSEVRSADPANAPVWFALGNHMSAEDANAMHQAAVKALEEYQLIGSRDIIIHIEVGSPLNTPENPYELALRMKTNLNQLLPALATSEETYPKLWAHLERAYAVEQYKMDALTAGMENFTGELFQAQSRFNERMNQNILSLANAGAAIRSVRYERAPFEAYKEFLRSAAYVHFAEGAMVQGDLVNAYEFSKRSLLASRRAMRARDEALMQRLSDHAWLRPNDLQIVFRGRGHEPFVKELAAAQNVDAAFLTVENAPVEANSALLRYWEAGYPADGTDLLERFAAERILEELFAVALTQRGVLGQSVSRADSSRFTGSLPDPLLKELWAVVAASSGELAERGWYGLEWLGDKQDQMDASTQALYQKLIQPSRSEVRSADAQETVTIRFDAVRKPRVAIPDNPNNIRIDAMAGESALIVLSRKATDEDIRVMEIEEGQRLLGRWWVKTIDAQTGSVVLSQLRSEVRSTNGNGASDLRRQRREALQRAADHEDQAITAFEKIVEQQTETINKKDALEFFGTFLASINDVFKSDENASAEAAARQGFRAYQAFRSFKETSQEALLLESSDQPVFRNYPAERSELIVVTNDRPGLTSLITNVLQANIVRDWAFNPIVEDKEAVIVMVFEFDREGRALDAAAKDQILVDLQQAFEEAAQQGREQILDGRQSNARGIFEGSAAVLQGFGYGVSDVIYDIYAGLNASKLDPAELERQRVQRSAADVKRFYEIMEERVIPLIESLPQTFGIAPEDVPNVLDFVDRIENKIISANDIYRQNAGVTQYQRSTLSRFLKEVQLQGPSSGLPKEAVKAIDRIVLQALKERFFIYDPDEVTDTDQPVLIEQQQHRLAAAADKVLGEMEKNATQNTASIFATVRLQIPEIQDDISSQSLLAEEAVTNTAIKLLRKLQRSSSAKSRATALDFQNIYTRLILELRGGAEASTRGEVMSAEFSGDIVLFVRHGNVDDIADKLEEFRGFVKVIVTDDPEVTKDSHWIQMADNDFGVPTVILAPGALDATLKSDIVGETVIVDAGARQVYIRPSEESRKYLDQESDFFAAVDRVALQEVSRQAITQNGIEIQVRASAEYPDQIRSAMEQGASGLGLGRTEYTIDVNAPEFKAWLSDESPETRDALIGYFKQRFDGMLQSVHSINSRSPATLRTYDFERDKDLGLPNPQNQFGPAFYATPVGRELLKIELVGMLQSGLDYPQTLRIMFPAFRNPKDLKAFLGRTDLKDLTPQEQARLDDQARADIDLMEEVLREAYDEIAQKFGEKSRRKLAAVQIGFMIETQEGLNILDHILARADFISMGTTDMTISLFREFENMSRDNPQHASKFDQLQEPMMQTIRRILTQVSEWNKQHQTDIGVDFCGGLAGVDTFVMGVISAKPANVRVGVSRSPRLIASTKYWIRHASQGVDNQAAAEEAVRSLRASLRELPEVQAALEEILAEREIPEEITEIPSEQPDYLTLGEQAYKKEKKDLPEGHSAESRHYQLGPRGFHIGPLPPLVVALRPFKDVSVTLIHGNDRKNLKDILDVTGYARPASSIVEVEVTGTDEDRAAAFNILETVRDPVTAQKDAAGNEIPDSAAHLFTLFDMSTLENQAPIEILPQGPSSESIRKQIYPNQETLYREPPENGNTVYTQVIGPDTFKYVLFPAHLAVYKSQEGRDFVLAQNVLESDDEHLNITLMFDEYANIRPETLAALQAAPWTPPTVDDLKNMLMSGTGIYIESPEDENKVYSIERPEATYVVIQTPSEGFKISRLHEGEREHFLDIPTDHAEFGTFALFIMDVAMPRANSEVRSVLDALRKTDLYSDTVPVEISRDEIKKNFGPGWEKLPVEERALLSGLLDRMRIRFRTTSLPAKTGQVFFDMPSFSILRDLFTAMPELEGRQGPQSRILNILERAQLDQDDFENVRIDYLAAALVQEPLGEGHYRFADVIRVDDGSQQLDFTASIYREYKEQHIRRMRTEQQALQDFHGQKLLAPFRGFVQKPYGYTVDADRQTIITYKSFIPGISLWTFVQRLAPDARGGSVELELLEAAFRKLGTWTGHLMDVSQDEWSVPDAHLGNFVVDIGMDTSSQGWGIRHLVDIDLEEGVKRLTDIESRHRLMTLPVRDLVTRMRDHKIDKPWLVLQLSLVYLTAYFTARYDLDPQSIQNEIAVHLSRQFDGLPMDELSRDGFIHIYGDLEQRFSRRRSEVRPVVKTAAALAVALGFSAAPEIRAQEQTAPVVQTVPFADSALEKLNTEEAALFNTYKAAIESDDAGRDKLVGDMIAMVTEKERDAALRSREIRMLFLAWLAADEKQAAAFFEAMNRDDRLARGDGKRKVDIGDVYEKAYATDQPFAMRFIRFISLLRHSVVSHTEEFPAADIRRWLRGLAGEALQNTSTLPEEMIEDIALIQEHFFIELEDRKWTYDYARGSRQQAMHKPDAKQTFELYRSHVRVEKDGGLRFHIQPEQIEDVLKVFDIVHYDSEDTFHTFWHLLPAYDGTNWSEDELELFIRFSSVMRRRNILDDNEKLENFIGKPKVYGEGTPDYQTFFFTHSFPVYYEKAITDYILKALGDADEAARQWNWIARSRNSLFIEYYVRALERLKTENPSLVKHETFEALNHKPLAHLLWHARANLYKWDSLPDYHKTLVARYAKEGVQNPALIDLHLEWFMHTHLVSDEVVHHYLQTLAALAPAELEKRADEIVEGLQNWRYEKGKTDYKRDVVFPAFLKAHPDWTLQQLLEKTHPGTDDRSLLAAMYLKDHPDYRPGFDEFFDFIDNAAGSRFDTEGLEKEAELLRKIATQAFMHLAGTEENFFEKVTAKMNATREVDFGDGDVKQMRDMDVWTGNRLGKWYLDWLAAHPDAQVYKPILEALEFFKPFEYGIKNGTAEAIVASPRREVWIPFFSQTTDLPEGTTAEDWYSSGFRAFFYPTAPLGTHPFGSEFVWPRLRPEHRDWFLYEMPPFEGDREKHLALLLSELDFALDKWAKRPGARTEKQTEEDRQLALTFDFDRTFEIFSGLETHEGIPAGIVEKTAALQNRIWLNLDLLPVSRVETVIQNHENALMAAFALDLQVEDDLAAQPVAEAVFKLVQRSDVKPELKAALVQSALKTAHGVYTQETASWPVKLRAIQAAAYLIEFSQSTASAETFKAESMTLWPDLIRKAAEQNFKGVGEAEYASAQRFIREKGPEDPSVDRAVRASRRLQASAPVVHGELLTQWTVFAMRAGNWDAARDQAAVLIDLANQQTELLGRIKPVLIAKFLADKDTVSETRRLDEKVTKRIEQSWNEILGGEYGSLARETLKKWHERYDEKTQQKRSEVREQKFTTEWPEFSPVRTSVGEVDLLTGIWRGTVSSREAAAASLAAVRAEGLGQTVLPESYSEVARSAQRIYAPAEQIAERLNLPLLEVYGRLLRELLEEAGDDTVRQAQVREIIHRHLGEASRVLEGTNDVNYQYLELADVSELNENTPYALAVLSMVRPRGDEIRIYVTGEDPLVREKISGIVQAYEALLSKLGAASRANLEMINASGWTGEQINKDMIQFATGKNGKLEAAVLSQRADFLEGMPALAHMRRMNRAQIGRAEALVASPALLAAEALDEKTFEVLQMKDELERLGLGSLLSARFAQMIAEIRAVAASA